ncbi:hypothetical protein BD408DRAFT_418975 [Parasitella parasitica]|nr:hypothetical protein BD408DRAFT_418975 [Parasitella parasitica]
MFEQFSFGINAVFVVSHPSLWLLASLFFFFNLVMSSTGTNELDWDATCCIDTENDQHR